MDLVGGRFAGGVAPQALFARLQELLGPAVVEVLVDAFLAAQLSNALLAAQAFEYDAELLLGPIAAKTVLMSKGIHSSCVFPAKRVAYAARRLRRILSVVQR